MVFVSSIVADSHLDITYKSPNLNGWLIYDAQKELDRIGIGKNQGKMWRITSVNKDYKMSESYPSVLCVPTGITDDELL